MVRFTVSRKTRPASYLAVMALLVMATTVKGQEIIWDTVSTGKIRLVVSNHGSMGLNGIGGVNMDFTELGGDCDSTADVYLYSGGLFIIEEVTAGVDYRLNTGLYQASELSPVSFIPDPNGPPSQHFVGPDGSDAFFTGRFVNRDSTIGVERTYYAPTSGPPHDELIVVRTDLYVLDEQAHGPLAIGEVIDWDIPSLVATVNSSGFGFDNNTVYETVYIAGTGNGCQSNADRTAYSIFLGKHTASQLSDDACYRDRFYHGVRSAPVDSALMNPDAGGMEPSWDAVSFSGPSYHPEATNLQVIRTDLFDRTLAANDTLTLYTAIVSGKENKSATLTDVLKKACLWYEIHLRPGCEMLCGCCIGFLGDVNSDGYHLADIGDVTRLIDYLFISYEPIICIIEADINYDCIIDIADLTELIYYLFIEPDPEWSINHECPNDFWCE